MPVPQLRPRAAVCSFPMTNIRGAFDQRLSSPPRTGPFFSHSGLDCHGARRRGARLCVRKVRQRATAPSGELHHHPAGRQNLLRRRRIFGDPARSARSSSPAGSRQTLTKQQILELLSQPDLPRPERLWRAGGGARPISTRMSASSPSPENAPMLALAAEEPVQLRSRSTPRTRRWGGGNLVLSEMLGTIARSPKRPA